MMSTLKKRRDVAVEILNSMNGVRVARPQSTFYLFPNVTEAMQHLGTKTVEEFRKKVLDETGVSFTTRNHFGSPLEGEDRSYIRLAYSGIGVEDISEGLGRMKELLDQ
jgi:aspartate/methionine/tyrosine aminotransferase